MVLTLDDVGVPVVLGADVMVLDWAVVVVFETELDSVDVEEEEAVVDELPSERV